MKTAVEEAQAQLLEKCALLNERVKLLRDYATTPGSIWLARTELSQVQEIVTEIEQLLTVIKGA